MSAALLGTTEDAIRRFANERWKDNADVKTLGLKLCEEAGEVAGALVKIPQGRATEDDLEAEIGDVLIVLSQLAALRGKTLNAIRAKRFAEIQSRPVSP